MLILYHFTSPKYDEITGDEGNCTVRSVMICSLYHILSACLYQEKCDEWVMWHAWEREEILTEFWLGSLK